MPSISQLTSEIVTLVTGLPETTDKGFSVYNLDDLQQVASLGGLPIVGVSYEGGDPVENKADNVSSRSKATGLFRVRFSVILALAYESALSSTDTKVDATDLLDGLRSTMLGYIGVNTRPWRFVGEAPTPSDLEGVIFYGQAWETDIVITGDHIRS
jgi:hypothetical protein